MGKRKSGAELRFWLSAREDGREQRFIQCGNSLLLSDKFNDLKPGARYMYLCMAMESGGRREFKFPQSAAKKYGFKPATMWKYIEELESGGFIRRQSNANLRKANDYSFSMEWKGIPEKGIKCKEMQEH